MVVYELHGEALIPNQDRECGHVYITDAEEGCELCAVDWLLETGHADEPEDLFEMRVEIVREASHA